MQHQNRIRIRRSRTLGAEIQGINRIGGDDYSCPIHRTLFWFRKMEGKKKGRGEGWEMELP